MYIKLFLLNLREFMIKNYAIKILAVKKDNNIYYTTLFFKIILFFLKLIPFSVIIYLTNFFKYQIIYTQDDTYQISGITQNHILPVIFKFVVRSNYDLDLDIPVDIKPKIKYYNSSIPLGYVLTNNKLNNYCFIDITYLHVGKLTTKRILINETNNVQPLYNLFK